MRILLFAAIAIIIFNSCGAFKFDSAPTSNIYIRSTNRLEVVANGYVLKDTTVIGYLNIDTTGMNDAIRKLYKN